MTRQEQRLAARKTLAQKSLEVQAASILSKIISNQFDIILEDSSFTYKTLSNLAHQIFGLYAGDTTQASIKFKLLAKKAKTFSGNSSTLDEIASLLEAFAEAPELTYCKMLTFAGYHLKPEQLASCISNSIERFHKSMCGEMGTLYKTAQIAYR